jgi:hypothetical protein
MSLLDLGIMMSESADGENDGHISTVLTGA